MDIEGHDFIQRSDPRTETGRLSKNSSHRAFSSIANEEVSADKESKSIELDNTLFQNDHKQYSKLISRLVPPLVYWMMTTLTNTSNTRLLH